MRKDVRRRRVSDSEDDDEEYDLYELSEASSLLRNSLTSSDDTESQIKEKLKYPKSVFFIVSNEFCERFSYYGMRTILVIYLRNILGYPDNDATVLYHTFTMFCYFFPIFGAMIADSWLGKFRTIFYLSIIYAIGNVIVSIASATGAIDVPARELTILGLILIALGTGGIKPCVSAFGGDQFVLPQQERQLQAFFSMFYFAINAGSLISTFITPILRQDVKCLDQESCYPLAFGVPAALMVVSLIIFVIGKRWYVIKKPQGNVILQVCKTMAHAVSRKWHSKGVKRDHWLDHADDMYSRESIEGIKAALRVLFLFLPLPIFWALFDQQGSRWTFQATRMTGVLGSWSLKPDQMQVVNPLLILIFIPIFEAGIYPLFAKCNLLKRPLQRMGIGGLLAALAFIISAVVEFQLEPTYAKLPGGGEGQLRIFNGLDCPVNLNTNFSSGVKILGPLEMWDDLSLPASGSQWYTVSITGCNINDELPFLVNITERQAKSYFIARHGTNETVLIDATSPGTNFDTIDKSNDGYPVIKVLYNLLEDTQYKSIEFGSTDGGKNINFDLVPNGVSTAYGESDPATFTVTLKGDTATRRLEDVNLELGGVYTLVITESLNGSIASSLKTVTQPNSIHMLWLIPQYVVLTMGEVMYSITGLEFAFTQAPVSMKAVLTSGWLLTVAFGNLIVIIIAEAKIFDNQAYEFILFAGLMIVDMALFAFMSMGYKYVEQSDGDEGEGSHFPLEEKLEKEKNGIDNKNFKSDD